jgi:uncharacterized repeat protein (TIGR03803 family)
MKKVQEPTVTKTLTVATSRIRWRLLIGLVAAIVVMSVVVLSGQELKHVPPAAPSFVVLKEFYTCSPDCPPDGAYPYGGLTRDAAGNLYGTTAGGGFFGNGVVFGLSPGGGGEFLLYEFLGGNGSGPYAGLISDAAGNLYGTTVGGGASGNGVVFKLSPPESETVLYSFTGAADGRNPYAGLIRDAAGNLYGTTFYGGTENSACRNGCGVVFKVSPSESETVLHSFTGGTDGTNPQAGLTRDAAGNLYGTTVGGGAFGAGVVFELIRCDSAPTGYDFKVLYSFTGGADGGNPYAGLIRDAAGNLYGTTAGGGVGSGTVFKLIPCDSGYELKVLHSFTGADGATPVAGLIRDAAGNLYGTTLHGGTEDSACEYGCGVVFKLSPAGTETVLHSFTLADGANPYAGLIQDAAGNLYGTAAYGGISVNDVSSAGVVFRLAP